MNNAAGNRQRGARDRAADGEIVVVRKGLADIVNLHNQVMRRVEDV